MSRSRLLPVLILASVVSSGGCATPSPTPAVVAHPELEIWDRLSFGRRIPTTGGEVSDADWDKFLAEVVTPRFPSGFGVERSEGQWRLPSGVIEHERGYNLSLNHADTAEADRPVQEIVTEYKRRFSQDAVFRMRIHVDASF